LSGVEGDGLGQFLGGVGDIDILEDHGRAFAAKFEFDRHEVPPARLRY
jgi:hypothetical protein